MRGKGEPVKSALVVRVNGLIIKRVKIREYISDGQPTGEQELVIYDPLAGSFAADDSFDFEVKDLALPEVVLQALPQQGWQTVTLAELLRLLSAAEPDRPTRVRQPKPWEPPPEADSGSAD